VVPKSAKHKKSNTTIFKRQASKEKKAVNKTSADISHIQHHSGISSPNNATNSAATREKKA
jgi:hypothetical protein